MNPTHVERWRPIPGWEDRYEVSDLGRVRSKSTTFVNQFGATVARVGKLRATYQDPKGYQHVSLYRGNVGKRYAVHQLVMLAFVGPRPSGKMVCHNDGRPGNNALTNLQYGTNSDNQLDRALHGTSCRGQANNRNRHTPAEIRAMRRLYAEGVLSQRQIGERFGIRQAAVSGIVNRRTWDWLD